MTTTVFTPYPLSAPFLAELEARYGPLSVQAIPALRRMKAFRVVQLLRRTRGTVVLAIESTGAEGALPALRALTALTPVAHVELVRPGRSPEPIARQSPVETFARTAAATLDGARALVATDRATHRLLRVPRLDATPDLERGVLMLNTSPWLGLASGGAVAHSVGVANAFAAQGIAVTVATYGELPGLAPAVTTIRLPAPSAYALPPDANRFRFAQAAPAVRDAGVVYERAALGSTAGVALSRRLRVPLVVEWNGSEVWAARHWGGTTRFAATAARAEAVTLRHAYRVVTVSDALVEDLERRGVERNRIVVHPNGVDADRFDPARFTHEERHELRARYGVSDDAVLATFVGTFGYWHGAEVLAAAAHDVPIAFLFVGDGARAAEVRAALADLGDRAHLTGTVDPAEIPLHLAASDILVAPHVPNPDGSRFFGSPTKLFEYMASGRAIVASELDQIADVLAEGAALLVRPGDATDLARGLRLLAGDADLRAKLGESARARVLERYTWRHHVDAILAALR